MPSMPKPGRGSMFTWTGMSKVVSNLDRLSKIEIERVKKAITEETDVIVTRAKELTPVSQKPYWKQGYKVTKGGNLRDSGRRIGPKRKASGRDFWWQIVFGGKKAGNIYIDYAVYVHERSDLRHKVGTHHFLTKALNEKAAGFMSRVARKAKLPKVL